MIVRTLIRATSRALCALAMIAILVEAIPAHALVSVSYTTTDDLSALALGDIFTVDLNLYWDGSGPLQGVFASTAFDDSVAAFLGADWNGVAETAGSIFDVVPPPVFRPGLQRLGALKWPGDPGGLLRTVQYGGLQVPRRAARAST